MAETHNQAKAWNFNKSNTHPWVFFKFFKLYKWFADHAKHIFPRVLKRVFSPQRFFFFFWKKHVRGLLQKSFVVLTLSWRRPLSYRNRSIDLRSKSMDCLLYDNGLRHEIVKEIWANSYIPMGNRISWNSLSNPLSANPTKWSNSVFGHFLGLALKRLILETKLGKDH